MPQEVQNQEQAEQSILAWIQEKYAWIMAWIFNLSGDIQQPKEGSAENVLPSEDVYNTDGTRRIVRYYGHAYNELDEPLNRRDYSLQAKIGHGWSELMHVMIADDQNGTPMYRGVEIVGLTPNHDHAHYYYGSENGGNRETMRLWSSSTTIRGEDFDAASREIGIIEEQNLPERIDVESTISSFLAQIEAEDFSFPIIYFV